MYIWLSCTNEDDIFVNSPVIVLEMQNDINKIVGIGLIRNSVGDKRYNIYDWGNITDLLIKESIV